MSFFLKRFMTAKNNVVARPDKSAITTVPPQDLTLHDFELQHIIGKGTFSRVRTVKQRATGTLYALKYVDKQRCLRKNMSGQIVQERALLEKIRHPFIVNLHYAFQDSLNLYFVLDLMLGGDLRYHRLRAGALEENAVRLYVAEISSALAYLHSHGICHRDVKPENILLDAYGHAHLTDFNAAFCFSPGEYRREVAGTMVYMAPEILNKTGYTWAIDYWSLGITAYECLFGGRPFGGDSRDADVIRHAILHDSIVFPQDASVSREGMAAIAALLYRDPSQRLGCLTISTHAGCIDLRSHRWFKKIDWKKLEAKRVMPAFLPDMITSNRDDSRLERTPTPAAPTTPDEPSTRPGRRRTRGLSLLPEARSADLRRLEHSFAIVPDEDAMDAYKDLQFRVDKRSSKLPPRGHIPLAPRLDLATIMN